MEQKEIAKRIIEIHDIMDFIDDGYHNKDIVNLIKISNELFSKLNPINQKKCQEWFDKKASSKWARPFYFLDERSNSSRENYLLLYRKEESCIGDGFCPVCKGKCTLLQQYYRTHVFLFCPHVYPYECGHTSCHLLRYLIWVINVTFFNILWKSHKYK